MYCNEFGRKSCNVRSVATAVPLLPKVMVNVIVSQISKTVGEATLFIQRLGAPGSFTTTV